MKDLNQEIQVSKDNMAGIVEQQRKHQEEIQKKTIESLDKVVVAQAEAS